MRDVPNQPVSQQFRVRAWIGAVIESLETRRVLSAAPAVMDAQFLFLTAPQRIVVRFDADVSTSLGADDLQLQNHTTMTRVPTSTFALSNYDTLTNTATFTISGILPDGNYRLRVLRSGVTDPGGTPMAQDGVLDFFVLSGDANRDRAIDIGDFSALAANFNLPGNFAQGDFDYSDTTDISDFAILASSFNKGLSPLSAPTTRYTVTILPTFVVTLNTRVHPYSMNDDGAIVGVMHSGGSGGPQQFESFSWEPGDTQFHIMGAQRATGINNAGRIVGWNKFTDQPFHWTHGTSLQGLAQFGALGGEQPLAVNQSGVIVGNDEFGTGPPFVPQAMRWPTPNVIEPLPGRMMTDINDNGDMIGDGPKLYPAGGGPAIQIGSQDGLAISMNESREVVGVIGTYGIAPTNKPPLYETAGEPFYWKPGMTEPFMLEHAPHDNNVRDVQARSINSAGQIVGDGDNIPGERRGAVIWHQGMPYDLEDMVEPVPGFEEIQVVGAAAINDNGQIAAYGSTRPVIQPGFVLLGFLLTPVVDAPADAAGGSPPPAMARDRVALPPAPTPTVRPSSAFGDRLIDDVVLVEARESHGSSGGTNQTP